MRGTLDTSQILIHSNSYPVDPVLSPFPMKILETQSAVLSNYEVHAHLTVTRAKPRTTPQKHTNVNTILKEVHSPKIPPMKILYLHLLSR